MEEGTATNVYVCVCRTQGFLLTDSGDRAEEDQQVEFHIFPPCSLWGRVAEFTLFCLFLPSHLPKGQKPEGVLIWGV